MKQSLPRGFTLIEIMVSVSIMVMLTIIGVVTYSSVNKRSRDVKRKGDLEQIRSALEMYRSDNGYYPNVGAGSWNETSGLSDLVPVYLPAIPSDPQSSVYYYKATNFADPKYYGYCICGMLETQSSTTSTCVDTLPSDCNYGLKNP